MNTATIETNNASATESTETHCAISLSAKHAQAILSFAAKRDVRDYLNGFCIDIESDNLAYLVATDGHRLIAVRTGFEDCTFRGKRQVIVPSACLEFIYKHSKQSDAMIGVSDNHVTVSLTNGTSARFETINRQYPDWRRVIPSGDYFVPSPAVFNAEYLLDARKAFQAFGVVSSKYQHGRMFTPFDPKLITPKKGADEIPAFDSRAYNVTVETLSNQSAIYCESNESANAKYRQITIVVMPVRF